MVETKTLIGRFLTEAGMLPAGGTIQLPNECGYGKDLLPFITEQWEATRDRLDNRRERKHCEAVCKWCTAQRNAGARLTYGFPGANHDAFAMWLGHRLAWWPQGIPTGRRVSFVSSRLGRALDRKHTWFAMLRAACAQIDRQHDVLLTSPGTSTDRFVERCAALFGLRTLTIHLADDTVTPANWFSRIQQYGQDERGVFQSEVFLSPPMAVDVQRGNETAREQLAPARDRAVAALSDRLIALHVRPNGNLHDLLRARLNDANFPVASVFVAVGPQLGPQLIADELMKMGAVGWVAIPSTIGFADSASSQPTIVEPPMEDQVAATKHHDPSAPIIPMPEAARWQFLTHCTRRRDGPWPDEAEEQWIENLILHRADADHSALAALLRIIKHQRVVASAEAIRGGKPVVSLTSAPLAELSSMHVFRPHRGRWDFEPYGICIRRDWLELRGARPVTYGDDELWSKMSATDRPFFQRQTTKSKDASHTIDWTVEQEWRHVGDVDLHELPVDEGLVFVPSQREAEIVSRVSLWPVVVMPRAK